MPRRRRSNRAAGDDNRAGAASPALLDVISQMQELIAPGTQVGYEALRTGSRYNLRPRPPDELASAVVQSDTVDNDGQRTVSVQLLPSQKTLTLAIPRPQLPQPPQPQPKPQAKRLQPRVTAKRRKAGKQAKQRQPLKRTQPASVMAQTVPMQKIPAVASNVQTAYATRDAFGAQEEPESPSTASDQRQGQQIPAIAQNTDEAYAEGDAWREEELPAEADEANVARGIEVSSRELAAAEAVLSFLENWWGPQELAAAEALQAEAALLAEAEVAQESVQAEVQIGNDNFDAMDLDRDDLPVAAPPSAPEYMQEERTVTAPFAAPPTAAAAATEADLADAAVALMHNPFVPDEIDCCYEHDFCGHSQPPVGIRLQQILTYLSKQDAARDSVWEERVREIEDYLDFLEGGRASVGGDSCDGDADEDYMDDGLDVEDDIEEPPTIRGPHTRAMLGEARRRIEVHRLVECYRRPGSDAAKGTLSRAYLLPSVDAVPQFTHPHRARLRSTVENSELAFANRFATESGAVAAEKWRGRRGEQQAPASSVLAAATGDAAAAESSVQPARACLPTDGENEDENGGEDASNEDDAGVLGQHETHPYTAVMARYRRNRQRWMERARVQTKRENCNRASWVPLPHLHDAYAPRPPRPSLPPAMERDRQLLALLRGVGRLLLRASQVAPRPLLADVLGYVELGLRGEPLRPGEDGQLPLPLRPAYDLDTVTVGGDDANSKSGRGGRRKKQTQTQTGVLKRVNETEARWLQFLAMGSTSRQLCEPQPAGPDPLLPDGDKNVLDELHDTASAGNNPSAQEAQQAESSRTLYHAFALRLQALMDDPSDTRLFQAADTKVTIPELVQALNMGAAGSADTEGDEGETRGLQAGTEGRNYTSVGGGAGAGCTPQKTQFTLYDTLHFCARLSRAGHCRFQHYVMHDKHGIVQRPLLTLHPEHRVWDKDEARAGPPGSRSWLTRTQPPLQLARVAGEEERHSHDDGTGREIDVDDAIGAPRRAEEIDTTWAETLASGRIDAPLRVEVHDFFCILAYRFGITLRQLETIDRPQWAEAKEAVCRLDQNQASTAAEQASALRTWKKTYERLLRENKVAPATLADVVRLAHLDDYQADMTEAEAQVRVRHNLLAEAERAETRPVLPTIKEKRKAGEDNKTCPLWDWARPQICGVAPQFFHMDRWPLHLQTPATAQRVAEEACIAFDPEVLWDPASEDPARTEYIWNQVGRFGFKRQESAEPRYLLGDTALQRQAVIQMLTRHVAEALGDVEERPGLLTRLTTKIPFLGPYEAEQSPDVIIFEETPLPEVAASQIPPSINWVAKLQARRNVKANRAGGDSLDIQNGIGDDEGEGEQDEQGAEIWVGSDSIHDARGTNIVADIR